MLKERDGVDERGRGLSSSCFHSNLAAEAPQPQRKEKKKKKPKPPGMKYLARETLLGQQLFTHIVLHNIPFFSRWEGKNVG